MADATIPGLEVQELAVDEHHTAETEPLPAGWPVQRRRKGSSTEVPAPRRYLDLPEWLTVPAKRPLDEALEEEETV
jgi:hypothetical protein